MAIDTPEKRKSISGINYFNPGVTPNSGQDAEWRQEVGYSYSGIAAGGATVPYASYLTPTITLLKSTTR